MGAEQSKTAAPAAGPDACKAEIDAYLSCVEARKSESGGLRDGDECQAEGEAYRECRRKAREAQRALKQQKQQQQA